MEIIHENPKTLRNSGSAGFDFMNTAYYFGHSIEILDSPTALLHWLVGANLLDQKDIQELRERFSANELNRLLTDALELRALLRTFTEGFKKKKAEGVSREDLQYLNNILRRGSSHLQAEIRDKTHLELHHVHEWRNIEEILALIVESVIHTLSTENFELIKRCSNPVCPLWFVDETKAHRRQWCSQAICGNRAKQAAFRNRQKKS